MDSRCDDVRLSFLNATRCFILPLFACRAERGAANAGLAAQPLAWGYAECGARGQWAGGRGRKAGRLSAERWWDDRRCADFRCNVWLPMLRLQRLGAPIVRVPAHFSRLALLGPPLPCCLPHCSETHCNFQSPPKAGALAFAGHRVFRSLPTAPAARRLDTRCRSSSIPAVQPSGVPAALALERLPAKAPAPTRHLPAPPLAAAMGAASSRPEPAHRSLNCRVPTTVEFVNDTGLTVQTVRGASRGRRRLHCGPTGAAVHAPSQQPTCSLRRSALSCSHAPCLQVWINYNRDECVYFTLAPGAHVRQPTFTCHPWRFQAPDAPGVLCVVGDQAIFYPPPKPQPDAEPPQARIVLASSLPWSPRTHAAFPEAFRREAATLLCCHHRLQRAGYHGARSGGDASTPASAPEQEQRQLSKCLPAWMAGLQRLGSGSSSGRSRPGTPRARRSEGDAAPAAAPGMSHLGELPQVGQCKDSCFTEPCFCALGLTLRPPPAS